MKKIYRLKEPLATHFAALYGEGAKETVEAQYNALCLREKGLVFKTSRFWESPLDTLNFDKFDFEKVVEYDPDDWNIYPDCKPTKDEENEYFICRALGKHPKTNEPWIPILCQYRDWEFWLDKPYSDEPDDGSFSETAIGPFMFKKVKFPKELK